MTKVPVPTANLAALAALLSPAPPTRVVTTAAKPSVRARVCAKCPYGQNLTPAEQAQATALTAQLAADPARLWGCHETADGSRPQVCAGWAAAHPERVP